MAGKVGWSIVSPATSVLPGLTTPSSAKYRSLSMYSDSLNPFGLLDGQLVTINDVSSGLACGCLCPSCKQPLVARKGRQNVHHFAHSVKTDCKGSLESALHVKAKDVFLKHKHIILPAVPGQISNKVVSRRLMLDGHTRVTYERPCFKFEYNDVFVESSIGQIRPDVVLFDESGPFIVEIYATHKTGFDKIQKIKSMGLFAVEIDLRYLLRLDLLDEKLIENAVIHAHHTKRWISI